MTPFVVVSYFTAGTGYEAEAKKLVRSLEALEIDHVVASVPNLGSWQKNTHYKARFILTMLDDPKVAGRPVVFVDADAIFHAKPELFWTLDCDAAFAYRDYSKFPSRLSQHRRELLSGTIYFANNPAVRGLIQEWIIENEKNLATWEQKNLQSVIGRIGAGFRFAELPPTYCKIFDIMKAAGPPVIEHYQKSRIYRRQVDRRLPVFAQRTPMKGLIQSRDLR